MSEDLLDRDALHRRIADRLAQALGTHGWSVHMEGDEEWTRALVRATGEVRQRLSIGVYVSGGLAHVLRVDRTSELVEPPSRAQLSVELDLASDRVATLLRALLPEDAEYLESMRRQAGMRHADVSMGLSAFFPDARGIADTFVASVEEVDAWTDRFVEWYRRAGGPALDACRDLESLGKLAYTRWSLQAQPRMELPQMLAVLPLVHFANDPEAAFLDWLGVVRQSQRDLRSAINLYERDGREDTPVPPEVRANQILERLIERLRRRRPPNT